MKLFHEPAGMPSRVDVSGGELVVRWKQCVRLFGRRIREFLTSTCHHE